MSKVELVALKDLLERSGEITDNRIVRENFCTYIGIRIDDISPDGIASLNNDQFIDKLLGYLESTDNTSAFCQLCLKIEHHFKSPGELQDKLNNIKDKLCPKQQDKKIKESYLLITVNEDNTVIRLEAWVSNNIGNYLPLLKKEPSILQIPSKKFSKTFRKIYQNALDSIQNDPLFPCKYIKKIKVFLPYNLFIKNNLISIDEFVIDEKVPSAQRTTFGKDCEITLDFLERFKNTEHHISVWNKKREYFHEISTKSVKDILYPVKDTDTNDMEELKTKLSLDNVVGIKFINFINQKTLSQILLYNGIPFALWVRKDIKEINIEETLNHIIGEVTDLENLSNMIKQQRIKAKNDKNHIGNHLSLMCDTGNLLPPPLTSKLSMP